MSVRVVGILLNLIVAVATTALAVPPRASADDRLDFNRHIRPILSDKCLQCHGPDAEHREADLRLDIAPAQGDRVIVPGKPNDSELVRRIASADADVRMPPPKSGKTLTAEEIATLRRWIEQGASWSAHWSTVKPVRKEPPAVADAAWSGSAIDRFLKARMEREGVTPAPEADRATLIRRLSFDLRGLPPTFEEVDAFVRDTDAKAWETLVDRFLASEASGERLATWWLDLVRFADTVGYHGDQVHNITPYRDWVIDAFVADMPFDRFTREQLAGDLIEGGDADAATDRLIASGYNRLLQTSHEGGVQAKEYLAMYAADRVRNLSGVWLGATIGCAQCHNHKFDPYTTRDFYALSAFFADLDEAAHLRKGTDGSPTVRAPEKKVHTARERARLAEWRAKLATLKQGEASDAERRNEIETVEKRIATLEQAARLTMISAAIEPRPVRVLPRGNWLDETGPLVTPAVPEFLGDVGRSDVGASELNPGKERATRLDLARWLTDTDRGVGLLTARVQANRLWSLMFGAGLCRSLEDFGGQGEPPDHPELLDRLAHDLVGHGWRMKPLLKQIALSRAYRQTSAPVSSTGKAKDPENRLVARQARFRLPAEMVRDNALAVSGLLVNELGGPSVKPYQPEGYYKHLNFPKRDYQPDADARQWRRGLYVHWQRQFLHPMLKAFDAPRREECVAQRPRSNTPLAALTLLNDPTFVEAARALAARVVEAHNVAAQTVAAQTVAPSDTDDARLTYAFRTTVSRPPDEVERRALRALLTESRAAFAADGAAAERLLKTGFSPPSNAAPNAPQTAELAAWTMVARALLNLSETVTRP